MVGRNGGGLDDLGGGFGAWRRERARGSRIPEHLWQAAVEAAREQGVWKTAKHIGVDYNSLKRRMKGTPAVATGDGPSPRGSGSGGAGGSVEFVEIPGKVLSAGPGCVVELQDGKGLRLRVELRDAAGAESLARSLWRKRR